MRFAYADPPYLGLGRIYAKHHPDALAWDSPGTHEELIGRLASDYPDGWALSLHSPSLKRILPMCPEDVRVAAWVKPFASWKPGVNPAYCWEPVIFRGGRRRDRDQATVRDFVSSRITFRRGLPGAKPDPFCWWIFDLLGAEPDDEMHDLFPGTGAVGRAWEFWKRSRSELPLFG